MIEIIVYLSVVILVVFWCYFKWNNRHFEKLSAKMPGPPSYPIVGIGHNFIGSQEKIMSKIFELLKDNNNPFSYWLGPYFAVTMSKPEDLQVITFILQYNPIVGIGLQFIGSSEQIMSKIFVLFRDYNPGPFSLWLGPYFGVGIAKPKDLKIVLNSSKALHKGRMYNFFKNYAGEGLFTAPVDKWRGHRRMITPAFNAKLLGQFFPVFNEKNKILIRNVAKGLNETQTLNLWEYIGPASLDTICRNNRFRRDANLQTMVIPGNHVFNLFKTHWSTKSFQYMNKFPLQVIKEKKVEFDQRRKAINAKMDVTGNDDGSKYAMLSMKVTVSTFLRHFSVHTDIKLTDIKLKLGILMRSVHGYPVTIRPRDRRPSYNNRIHTQ